jgi:hypothetical protein
MLLNITAHNESKRNVKVSKHERHIKYSVTKNVQRHKTLGAHYVSITKRFVMVYLCDAVRYVTFTL